MILVVDFPRKEKGVNMERSKAAQAILVLSQIITEQDRKIKDFEKECSCASESEDEIGDRLQEALQERDEARDEVDKYYNQSSNYYALLLSAQKELDNALETIKRYEANTDLNIPLCSNTYSRALRLAYEYMILEGKNLKTFDGKFNRGLAIKGIRTATGWSLWDTKNFVEGFMSDDF